MQDLSHRHLVTGDASWSLFKDGLFGKNDSHSFKFGALYETASTTDEWRRNGGFTYYDDSTLCPGERAETRETRKPTSPTRPAAGTSARRATASTRSTASTRASPSTRRTRSA